MKDTTDHIVDPTYDHRAKPWFEHGDERPSNWSGNPTFYDVVDTRFSRRGVLAGGLAAAVAGAFTGGLATLASRPASAQTGTLLGFSPIAVSEADTITVPEGYRHQVLIPSGTPITGDMPAHSLSNSGAEQGMQIGMHHDGMHYFGIDGSSTDGYLVLNHEYVEPRFLHAAFEGEPLDSSGVLYDAEGRRDADQVLKEINAHGVSIVRVTRTEDGTWSVVEDPTNRRITALTPMRLSGPAAGSDYLKTRFSPDGVMTRGTLNNCAYGVTPWGTYMSAEENWAGYFLYAGEQPREMARYGVPDEAPGDRYGWQTAVGGADEFVRFDATPTADAPADDYRNEPNGFGWMVEIDWSDPDSVPVKRTHLGRFAHEGVIFAPAAAGQPVVAYSGDDSRFEYIYKFVSAEPFDPETTTGDILDTGTLYAAKFDDDGTGEWLALEPGADGLTAEDGFATLADVLVNTRAAADAVGATKMDRPEWGAVDPNTGEVYFTLTNNNRRMQTEVNMANPRAVNEFGHIIRWTEAGGDHAATTFEWDLFVIAGSERMSSTLEGQPLDDSNLFACPDGLYVDAASRVWIQTDIGEDSQNLGEFAAFGNNQMLCADSRTGEIRRFLTGPVGQEITGLAMTPDGATMFINVQHPGATTTAEEFATGALKSNWPDAGGDLPRSATVVISREDGAPVGS